MNIIYKYELPIGDTHLELPIEANVLSVQEQNGKVCMWVQHDTSYVKETRKFVVFATGQKLPSDLFILSRLAFLDTVQLMNGALVFHVYEVMGENKNV